MISPERLVSTRRMIMQIVGFGIGIALLVWLYRRATAQGGWDELFNADPRLLALTLLTTFVSGLINGAIFWVTIRPVQRLGFLDLQILNLFSYLLNYAPVRLGAVARIAYHMRVDRMRILRISAWFFFIVMGLGVGVGATFGATMLRTEADTVWLLIVFGLVAAAALMTPLAARIPLLDRFGGDLPKIMSCPTAVAGSFVLRIADIAMYALRLGLVAAILKISLTPGQVVILAVVALCANLIPLGRLGFREFCVAMVAHRLDLGAETVEQNMEQLALLDSVAELLVFIPLGLLTIPWFRRRLATQPLNEEPDSS